MKHKITINCDLGEGIKNEASIFQFIDRASIACGGHFGDVKTIYESLVLANNNQVNCGAHPSFPDKENFGRKPMKIPAFKLKDALCFQLEKYLEVSQKCSMSVDHIKAHGALYNVMMHDLKTAETLIYAREDFGLTCPIFALCDSPFYREFNRDIPLLQEAFVDRMYTNEKTLASRNLEGSVIENVNAAMEQYLSLIHISEPTRPY